MKKSKAKLSTLRTDVPSSQHTWYPLSDEPDSMLVTYELTDGYTLYDLRTLYVAFRPIVGLKLEKQLAEGFAVVQHSVYALAWLGVTPFARELTKWHTYETYYQEKR